MASSARKTERQEAVITVLLVIAGILLAICIFAAGLLWRGKPRTHDVSTAAKHAGTDMLPFFTPEGLPTCFPDRRLAGRRKTVKEKGEEE